MPMAILFSAPRFRRTMAIPFIVAYFQQITIGKAPWEKEIGNVLLCANQLGRHSDIFVVSSSPVGGLDSMRYVWASPYIRPYGRTIDDQCDQCGRLHCEKMSGDMSGGNATTLTCTACGRSRPIDPPSHWERASKNKVRECGDGTAWYMACRHYY